MQLSEIRVHPIKSLRGVAVARARVLPAGLEHDRRWMLVDEDGRFVSQREEPGLARLGMELVDGGYRVTGEDDASLVVPAAHAGPRVRVRVWESDVEAVAYEPGAAFFSSALDRPLRLVFLPGDVVRETGSAGQPGDRVSFADAYPYLLIAQGSLDLLNTRVPAPPLSMTRFRPNFVVVGAEPHAEDGWARLRIGDVAFRGVKRSDRCVLTTVDPLTGEKGPEPLRTLARYRREDGKVWFGMNLAPDGEGWVQVGDEIEVLETIA